MSGESATTTYSIPEPFDDTLKLVRTVLDGAGLPVLEEMDVSGRIQRDLRIEIARCRVLYICSKQLPEAMQMCPAVGMFVPLRIVIAACSGHTEIHLLASLPPAGEFPASTLAAQVKKLQSEVSRAIEKIAMHHSYCQLGV